MLGRIAVVFHGFSNGRCWAQIKFKDSDENRNRVAAPGFRCKGRDEAEDCLASARHLEGEMTENERAEDNFKKVSIGYMFVEGPDAAEG
jgi:hypothetical protein